MKSQTKLAILWLGDLKQYAKPRRIADYIACQDVKFIILINAIVKRVI